MNRSFFTTVLVFFISWQAIYCQSLENIGLSTRKGLNIEKLILENNDELGRNLSLPVFSFELNGSYYLSSDVNVILAGTRFMMSFDNSLEVSFTSFGGGHPGWRGRINFRNEGSDTIDISNVLPLGENKDNVYITGKGPWDLARAYLHRPAYEPLRVILPDNAWELGFTVRELDEGLSFVGLARRGIIREL